MGRDVCIYSVAGFLHCDTYYIYILCCSYIYTDDIVITPTNVTAIYCAAKKFCLGGLVDLCIQILSEGVVVETVCKILEQAHQYGEKTLQVSSHLLKQFYSFVKCQS